jgi:serine/threonine protein kinase/WD40 repeat protein
MTEVEMLTVEQSEKVAVLFEECIELSDPVERAAFLDAACPDNPEVRTKVERLLKAHEACGKFLQGTNLPDPETWENQSGLDPEDLEPGGRVGPYQLLGLMGEGSTSTVFLAEQEDPVHRWVALKVVKLGMDSRKVVQRFSLERQALALMDHPGIAKLLDAGATSSGRPFFVMELVSGAGITTFCDEHRLSVPQRLELFVDICSAVLHAHQRGIIHRDIKPDNILVTDLDGAPSLKIIDFGIAKVINNWYTAKETRTGPIPFLGTPAYMSPEQVHLNAPDLDTRTDIYSMGALLYELLTGHPPFDHERLVSIGLEEMFRIIKNEEPPPASGRIARMPMQEQIEVAKARGTTPSELIRTLKGDLDWITSKALEKEPDRRYPTADGFAHDIRRHFENQPVSAAAPSKRYRLVKMLKRNRKLVAATGAAALLLLTSTILISMMAVAARRSANQAREMEKAASAAEDLSHQALVAMHVSSGMSAADDNYHDKALLWFANSTRLANDSPLQKQINAKRALNWIERVPLPVGAFKLGASFRTLEFSADSRFLLALSSDRDWSVWNCETRQQAAWPNKLGPLRAAAWSPDGSQLALVLPAGEIRVYDPSGGDLLHAFSVNPAPDAIVFSPDSRHLVFGGSTLQVYDLDAERAGVKALNFDRKIVGLAFANDSTMVIGVSETGWAQMFDFQDGLNHGFTEVREFPHLHAIRTDSCSSKSNYEEDFLKTAVLSLPAITPRAKRLLTRTGSYEITLWDLDHGRVLDTIEEVCCSCRFVICPDSDQFASGIQGGKVGIWELDTARQTQVLPSKGACVLDVAFGNHGRNIITAETTGRARVWSVEHGLETQSPLTHCTDVDRVAYSHNGLLVATGQSDGLVRVWNVLEAQPVEHSPERGGVPTAVRMDAQGTRFVLTAKRVCHS